MKRTWLITGCASGIGSGIARAALEQGDQVVLTDRSAEKLSELQVAYPDTACAMSLDVTDSQSRKNAVEKATERFGQIDVLVNCAGYGYRGAVEETEEPEIEKLFAVNFFGPAALTREVLPQMRARKSGTIVNFSSIGGVRGAIGNGWYSSAKGALELLSDTLYKECAPLGIRVLIIEPGAFRTGFYGALRGAKCHIADYEETVGKMYLENMNDQHDQLGDPVKAGQTIVRTVSQEKIPKRLPLGSDAVDVLKKEYESRLDEMEAWKAYSFHSDFDK